MAVEYDKNDLQTQFEGIRDERRLQANTAYRIGTAFLSLLHFATDEMHTTIEELLKKIEGKYLSKVKNDEAAGLITFLRGLRVGVGYKFDENGDIISRDIEAHDINANDLSVGGNSVFAGGLSSPDFVAGFLTGKGWRLKNEPVENAAGVLENKYNLELDNLIVRGSMRIFEMIISQLLGENDNRIFTAMMEVDHYDAKSGRVYLDTKEGRMYNSFRKGDYIMVQQYNGLPSDENDHYVTKNYELLVKEVGTEGEGENRLAWVTFENFTSSMAGATPEKLITKRDTFVRVDNVSDPDRKGIIQVMTVGSDTPYIDIVHGMKTNPDSALKGRIGNLKGIRHPILGQLKGFGEYLNNLYAVGEFVLSRTGESIDTKFQVLENMFSSRFSKTSYELTNEKNYLENGQFLEQITDSENKIIAGWDIDTTDESVFWFDASGLPVMVNGNPTASGNRKVSLEKVDGRQILRVQNCGIRQKNALIRQPGTHREYVAVEKSSAELPPTEAGYTDVQDKLYISVRIYAKTAGALTLGFADCTEVRGKQNTLQKRTINVAYSGAWKTIPIEGVWNGTGDFVIQYTGDCYLAIASLTDEPLSELSKTVSTQIVQTANNIKLLGENIDTVNKKAVKVGFELDAEKGEIRQYVDSKDAKNREDTSSQITQTASNITSTVDKQLKDQYGNITSEYQSAISQSADQISLKVSAAQSTADNAKTAAGTAQSTANAAKSSVAELKITVNNISSTVANKADTSTLNSKVSALNSSISSAKQSAIDTVNARIDGGVGEFYQQSSLPSFSKLSWTDANCQRHAGALWYVTYPAPSGYTAGHLYRFTVMRGTGSKWEDVDDSIDTATTVTQNSDGWSVAAGMFSGQSLTAKGIATITPTVNSLCNSRIDDRKNEIRSGLVTTADFAALQTTVAGHTASISTSVQKDGNGYITNASIKADRIKLEGLTTVNNYFKVLTDGSIKCVNADVSGDLKVTNMRYATDIVVNGKVACSCITAGGSFVLPDLAVGEIMRVEVYRPMITRSTMPVTLTADNGVFLKNSQSCLSGESKLTLYGWVQLMGSKQMGKTFWVYQILGN
nr:MAG TPA: tail protein [Caudoviricetes sp.]